MLLHAADRRWGQQHNARHGVPSGEPLRDKAAHGVSYNDWRNSESGRYFRDIVGEVVKSSVSKSVTSGAATVPTQVKRNTEITKLPKVFKKMILPAPSPETCAVDEKQWRCACARLSTVLDDV
jgi:hypothetical protein